MATYTLGDGTHVDLQMGDDVELEVADGTVDGGVRRVTGQVTAERPEENALWVRGVRVDMQDARIRASVPTDDPANLTPPPTAP